MRNRLIPLVLLLVAACSPRTGSTFHSFRSYRENGVRVVETTGGPMYTDPLFSFEEVLRLEQDPAREETLYHHAAEFVMGPAGGYYLLDQGRACILRYDAEGRFIGTFGGKGDGPGEFNFPTLEAIEGDTLILYDQNQMRLTRFRTDGTLLDVIPTRDYGWVPFILPLQGERFVVNTGNSEIRGDYMYRASRCLILTIADRDTVCSVSTGLVQNGFVTRSDRGFSARSIPFAAQPSARFVAGRGILVTDGARPELTWYDLAGEVRMIVRLNLPARELTAEVKQDYERSFQQRQDELAELRGRPSRPIGEVHYPDQGGYWGEIIVDDSGYLWLRDVMSNPLWLSGEPWLHHVLSPEGRYLGTILLPCRTGTITRGRLLAIVADPETDEQQAIVYRIRPAVVGLQYGR